MTTRAAYSARVNSRGAFAVLLLAFLAVGALGTWWMVASADRDLRSQLLEQTHLVAKAVDIDRVKLLTGTTADLNQPAYLALKQQFAAIKNTHHECRFVYLMGRRANGDILILVDNEPPHSKDYSPPGQVYDEVPEAYRRAFAVRTAATAGPVSDRWGKWVSALVPLIDPQSEALIAVLGMDVDARAWRWEVASRAALPLGLMLALLILLVAGITAGRFRLRPALKPVLSRLMIPMVAMVLILVVGFGALMVKLQRDRLNESSRQVMEKAGAGLTCLMAEQTRALKALADILARDQNICEALKARDRQTLLAACGPVFGQLEADYGLTHFNWLDPQRVLVLRLHNPEVYGDRIDRFTARAAERSGRPASGIEAGAVGTFTLRVVHPVWEEGTLIGYVELGKGIGEIIADLHANTALAWAVTARKDALEHAQWNSILEQQGHKTEWDALADHVVLYSSLNPFPAAVEGLIAQGKHARGDAIPEVAFGGQSWRVMIQPFTDASGAEVGDLILMIDTSATKNAQNRVLAATVGGTLVVLAGLFAFLFVVLRNADRGIRAQQAEFRAQSEYLAATLRSIGDGVITTDPTGRITSLNVAAEHLTGSDEAAALGRPSQEVFRIVDAVSRSAAENPVENALRQGVPVGPANHTVLVARDGTERQIADSCAPIRDASGAVAGAVLVFRDQSAAHRAHSMLLARLTLLEYAAAHSLEEVLSRAMDEIGRLTESPIGFFHFVGPGQDTLSLQQWSSGTLERCRTKNKGQHYDIEGAGVWADCLRTGKALIHNDYAFLAHRKGQPAGHPEVIREMVVPVLRAGKAVAILGVGNKPRDYTNDDLEMVTYLADVTWHIVEGKRTAEALRDSEAQLRAITESAHDAIIKMDPQGNISFWNPAAEEIFGYPAEEALGRNLHRLLAPERYLEAHQLGMPEFVRNGRGKAVGKTVELAAKHKDGHELAIALSLSTVLLDGHWHAVGIVRDITRYIQAHKKLLETNRRLEETTLRAQELADQAETANRAKSEFLANMSHEIRTPMNGVIGMTELLLDTQLTDDQRRYAEITRLSAESLLGVINDILDFSKIEAKKLDLELMDFDLGVLMDDLTATLAFRAHEKGLELLCSLDPSVPIFLRGDPGRLRQILVNLTGNAIKFTQRGEVAVRVTVLSETDGEARLRFAVHDTGIGIPAEKIDTLFDKFTQVDASTTREFGGTGLGLAISKQLVELMSGEIGVESQAGKGSEFWFTVRLGKQAEKAQPDGFQAGELQGVRVLVVDDNATNREILAKRMEEWGMRPSEAQNGTAALEALYSGLDARDPFRIAVIDLQMPRMDGEALGRAIQADRRLSGTRMVLMSSLGARGDARRFADIGFAGYLVKPARNEELRAVLRLVLTEPGAWGEAQPRPIATRHLARETVGLFAGRKARILVAEDNITNQQVALGILKKLGLRADAVPNGAQALKALADRPYDAVLMDVQMPVMDGLEAARRIRRSQAAGSRPDIPIIAMTAHATQGYQEQCLEAGMNDYVSKPVTSRQLAEVLEKWLPADAAQDGQASPEIKSRAREAAPESRPAPAPPQAALVFDRAALMERLMGDDELAAAVLEGFLADMPLQIQALKASVDEGNAFVAERQAHTIKGAAATVGGEALRQTAFEMETACRTGQVESIHALLAALERQFQHLKAALEPKG